jgi:hypothetical protein
MASLKFYNTTTGQWEAIKTDSINGVIPNNTTWIATQGQTTFAIPNGTIADPKLITVFVDGKVRADFIMPNNTTIQFLTGINSGLQVYAQWFEVSVPATAGHHATHEMFGNDAIDVTKLLNYASQIGSPISNLQTIQSNHENRITTIEGKNLDSRVGTLETAKTTDENRITKLETNPYFYVKNQSQLNYGTANAIQQLVINSTYSMYTGCTIGTNEIIFPTAGIYNIEGLIDYSGLNNLQTAELLIRVYLDGVQYGDDTHLVYGYQGLGGNTGNYGYGAVPVYSTRMVNIPANGKVQFFARVSEAPRTINAYWLKGWKISN